MNAQTSFLLKIGKEDLLEKFAKKEITWEKALETFQKYLADKVDEGELVKIEANRQYHSFRKKIMEKVWYDEKQ